MTKAAGFIFAILLQVSFTASAFTLYRTPGGALVRWGTAEVEIVLDPSLKALGEMSRVEAIFEQAFYQWQRDAGIPVQFVLVQGECNEKADDDNNCIFACTDPQAACARQDRDKGAGAFLSVDAESGVIRDVDIVFNATDWQWDTRGHGDHALNLSATALHEIGHALGIDHSEERDARMYAHVKTDDDDNLSLHNDDIAAAQQLYEDFTPLTESDLSACTVVAPGAESPSFGLILFAAGLSGVFMRRGRKETR